MSALGDDLRALVEPGPAADAAPRQKEEIPKEMRPRLSLSEDGGEFVTTPREPVAGEPDQAELFEEFDLNPAEWRITRMSRNRRQLADGSWRESFNVGFAPRPAGEQARVDLDDLLAVIDTHEPQRVLDISGDCAFVVAAGDMQLGKPDGNGTAGTVKRWVEKIDASVARLAELNAMGRSVDRIVLAVLGDCLEGVNSQGGKLVMRLELTITEQVRLYRRLLLYAVQRLGDLGLPLTVVVVPGNHDEAHRIGDKMATRSDDSWAIEGASAVQDALDLAGDKFAQVDFVFPGYDELTVALDVHGVRLGMAHGHQWRPGQVKTWLSGQALGRTPIGDADVLLSGHLHHWSSQQLGDGRLWVQVPALDGGSTWFRHLTGESAPAGVVTLLVGEGHDPLRDLAVV